MLGSVSLVALSARVRSYVLVAALASAFGILGLIAASSASALSCTSGADLPVTGSCFEGGDGDQVDPDGPTPAPPAAPNRLDWQSAIGTPGFTPAPDYVVGSRDSQFGPSGAEEVPDSWTFDVGSLGSDKYNIMSGWTYREPGTTDLFLALAFVRESNNGETHLAFELNQKQPGYRSAQETGIGGRLIKVPTRSTGDLLITYSVSNNAGTAPRIGLCKWNGTERIGRWQDFAGINVGDECPALLPAVSQAAMNDSLITGANNFLQPGTPLVAGRFGETSINLTEALKAAGGNPSAPDPCVSFGYMWMHSRSAPSITSNQQDYILPTDAINVANCAVTGVKFHDLDGDGLPREGDEPGLGGWTIFADYDNDGVLDNNKDATFVNDNDGVVEAGEEEPYDVTAPVDGNDLRPTGSYTIANIQDGSWNIREVLQGGWVCTFPSTCVHAVDMTGSLVDNINFGNNQPGKVRVVKSTIPDGDLTDFDFDPSANLSAGNFTRRDNQAAQEFTVQAGSYSVQELAEAGWDLTSIACSDTDSTGSLGTATATFNVAAGETVTCTFTNRKRGSVEIEKQTAPPDPKAEASQDQFGFSATSFPGTADDAFQLDDDDVKTVSVAPGAYGVSENDPTPGYDLTGLSCNDGASTTPSTTNLGSRSATVNVEAGETVRCVFTNTKRGTIEIEKQTVPADPQAEADQDKFGFAAASLPGTADDAFQLDDDDVKPVVNVVPGAYGVAENDPTPGYSLTGLACNDGASTTPSTTSLATRTATVNVDAGETVRCVYTNTKHASLTIKKATDPASDPQDFSFALTGAATPASLTLDTDGSSAGTLSEQTFPITAAQLGAYTVTEAVTPGWSLTNLQCTGGGADSSTDLATRKATLDIDAGESVVCTYTNTKHASLKVVKVTDPASDPQDFDFDLTGSGLSPDLDLDTDSGDATLQSEQTFPLNASQLGAKTVIESVTAGWTLTNLVCTGAGEDSSFNTASRTATLDIDAGETVVCTYTNTKAASLTVVKVTDPAVDPQDFLFDLTGSATPGSVTLDTDGTSAGTPSQQAFPITAAQLGAYTVTEAQTPGWSLTNLQCTGGGADSSTDLATRKATLDIDAGESVVCTYTNTKHASLKVVKVTDPASDPQDFDFDLTGTGLPADLDLDTDAASAGTPSEQTFALDAGQLGAKTVIESVTAGWTLTNLQCTGAGEDSSFNTATRTATLDIDAGESVVCTYTNTKHASLKVVKVTAPAEDPQDFDFDLTGTGVPADLDLDTDGGDATLQSEQAFTLNASQLGAKTVIESPAAGWTLTSLQCTGAGDDSSFSTATRTATLDIDAGENVECTYTNTKGAALTIVKQTDPSSDPQDFGFDLTGAATPATATLDTDAASAGTPSQETYAVGAGQLGAYTVTEDETAGWTLTNLVCTGGGSDSSSDLGTRKATLDIDAGESVVCTFTNTKHASLQVVKVTDPASDPQDFDFDLTGSGVPADLDLDTDGANATLPSQQSFTLNASQLGAKTVTESAQAGWDLTNLLCTGDADFSRTGATADLEIDAGESVVCTFTNTKHASLQVVKVTDPASDPQDFDFDLTGSGVPADLDLDTDGANATLPSQQSFTLNASQLGSKTVTESEAAGWTLTNLQCTGGGANTSTAVSTATVGVDAGESVVCTFTNTKDASLQVIKVTDPASDPQDFDFDLTGSGVPADLDLDTDGANATLPSQQSFTLNASQLGAKTVTESPQAGWTLTNLVCTGAGADSSFSTATRNATLDIDAGETVVCTFTNTKHASLQVVKVTDPVSDPQDFDFDLTGAATPAGVTLDTDEGSAGTPSQVTYQVTAAQLGAYTVTEDPTAGWSLTNLVCSGGGGDSSTDTGARKATLDIDAGETVVCTFTNTKDATVKVVKVTDPASDPQDFDFDLTGSGVDADLDLDTDPNSAGTPSEKTYTLNASQLGAHTVTESTTPGWTLTNLQCSGGGGDSSTDTGARKATLDIDAGETVVCTFTNTKDATVKVVKVTDPASDPQDFDFDLTGSGVDADLDLDTDPNSAGTPSEKTYTLNASQLGAHTVTESTTPGWTLTNLQCSGGGGDSSTDTGARKATLDVDAGETVVCTFTNTKDASLQVVKVTDPASDPQDFDFDLTGSGVDEDLDLDTDAASEGTPASQTYTLDVSEFGAHTVTESTLPDWDLTALACTGAGADSSTDLATRTATLDIDAGESVVCRFTNTKRAQVEIVKETVPAAFDSDFDFTTTGDTAEDLGAEFTLNAKDDASDSRTAFVRAGAYTVAETVPAGWDLTSVACTGDANSTGATGDAVLDLAPGDSVRCVFTNTKRGQAVVVKTEGGNAPEAGRTWTFTLSGGPLGEQVLTETTDGDGGSEGVVFDDLQPGTYTLCEVDMPVGWHSSLEKVAGAVVTTDPETGAIVSVCVTINVAANEVEQVAVDNVKPDIEIEKSVRLLPDGTFAETASAHVGDTVQYRFLVTNTGVGELSVVFSDPRCDAGTVTGPTGDTDGDGKLDKSETWQYLCSHVITAQDPDPLPNTATATGTDVYGNTDTDTDTATVDIIHPAIDIEKTGPATATVGDVLNYVLTITNTGDVAFAAQEVGVTDPRCSEPPVLQGKGTDATPGQFDPGDRWTYTCSAETIGQQPGTFVNTATVTGRDFLGKTVTDTDEFPTQLNAQQVIPGEVVKGTARLTGPSGCVKKAFNATVRGSRIAKVTFFVDGKKRKTITAKPGQRTFKLKVRPNALGRGVHRVTAKVQFVAESETKTKTLHLSFQRCVRKVIRPEFTG